jgi:hypothetical protein
MEAMENDFVSKLSVHEETLLVFEDQKEALVDIVHKGQPHSGGALQVDQHDQVHDLVHLRVLEIFH